MLGSLSSPATPHYPEVEPGIDASVAVEIDAAVRVDSQSVESPDAADRSISRGGSPLHGVVIDIVTGASVGGAAVTFLADGDVQHQHAVAHDDGTFTLSIPGEGRLIAESESHASAAPVAAAPGDWARVAIAPRRVISGRVLHRDGRPAELATVSLRTGGDDLRTAPRVTTDAAGRYRFAAAPPDAQAIEVAHGSASAVAGVVAIEEQLDVFLDAAIQVDVTVVDAESGAPIESAAVAWTLASVGYGARSEVATCDSHGVARLADVAMGELSANVGAEGFVIKPLKLLQTRTRGAVSVRVALERAVSIRGSVVDPAGAPVEGATVSVYWRSRSDDARTPAFSTNTEDVTGPEGSFTLRGLPAHGGHKVSVWHPGFQSLRVDAPPVVPGEVVEGLRLVCDPLAPSASPLTIRVIDDAGYPVADATVAGHPVRTDGSFQLELPEGFSYQVVAAPGRPSAMLCVDRRKLPLDPVEVVLPRGRLFVGSVTLADSAPVVAAQVTLRGGWGDGDAATAAKPIVVYTDDDGRYATEVAPAKVESVVVTAVGLSLAAGYLSDLTADTHDVVMAPAGRSAQRQVSARTVVCGTVIDTLDGAPVTGIEVVAEPVRQDKRDRPFLFPRHPPDQIVDHTFRLPLAPGRNRIQVRAESHEVTEVEILIDDESPAELPLQVRMGRGAIAAVRIVDEHGGVVPAVEVKLMDADHALRRREFTDAFGVARFHGLNAGRYRLEIASPHHALPYATCLEVPSPSPESTYTALPGGVLEVNVHRSCGNAPNPTVELLDADGAVLRSGVETSFNGRHYLPAGDYRFRYVAIDRVKPIRIEAGGVVSYP